MTRALWEIVIPLLIMFGVGLFVGWLLWRWRRGQITAAEWDGVRSRLKERDTDIIDLRSECRSLDSRVVDLSGDLETASSQVFALRSDLVDSGSDVVRLEGVVTKSTGHVSTLESGLSAANDRVIGLEAELSQANERATVVAGELKVAAGRASSLDTEVGRLEAEIAGGCGHDAELATLRDELNTARAQAAQPGAQVLTLAAMPEAEAPAQEADPTMEWAHGTTELGTPGAAHTDDLKVIKGIGPKMEAILNEFGITAWEQLAAFSPADVSLVNDRIETFPGRIERDEWVAQAQDLLERFPHHGDRPTRETFLNRSSDTTL